MASPEMSPEVNTALNFASQIAAERNQEYIGVDHVVFALLHDEATVELLQRRDIDVEAIKEEFSSQGDNSERNWIFKWPEGETAEVIRELGLEEHYPTLPS